MGVSMVWLWRRLPIEPVCVAQIPIADFKRGSDCCRFDFELRDEDFNRLLIEVPRGTGVRNDAWPARPLEVLY